MKRTEGNLKVLLRKKDENPVRQMHKRAHL